MDLSYHWRIFFISTHALTEGDAQNIYDSISAGHFNSRPHGGRQRTRADDNTGGVFQLTPSRRATEQLLAENEQLIISTHALTEGDPLYQDSDENYQAFQLTPSRRATGGLAIPASESFISTHALTEGDCFFNFRSISTLHFNSRPHGGRLQI